MRVRRDPRAERDARLIFSSGRRRLGLAPAPQPSARPRRDPRALRRVAMVAGAAQPRIDWYAGRTGATIGVGRVAIAEKPASEPQIRTIAEPAFTVLAVPDHPGGVLPDHDRELIGAARQFADTGGGAVIVLTAGEIEGLGQVGADRVTAFPPGDIGDYDPEGRAAAVLAAIALLEPRHVLFPESAAGGADVARRVAALSGERLFSGVEVIADGRVSRRMRGGAMEMVGAMPVLMSLAEGASAAHEGVCHEARRIEAPKFWAQPKIERAAPLKVEASAIALSDADFILSGGNGVTDWRGFVELGDILGATLGGSRIVCDEGHLPRDRQVGASGSLVTARCYLAFGIAGAPQHLQGITQVRHVVAINTDLHAEMIKRADLAIIANAQQVMPALIARVKAAGLLPLGRAQDLPSPLAGEGSRRKRVGEGDDLTANSEFEEGSSPSPGSAAPRSPSPLRKRAVHARGEIIATVEETSFCGGSGESAVAPKIAVLLSVGRHPASGRARRAPLDARALELALGLPGAEVCAVHAGDAAEPALRDYLGMGLERLTVLTVPLGSDPIPALSAHLAQLSPDMILCGGRAESGEDSGMMPYLIAHALGHAVIGDVAAISVAGSRASLIQALPRGKRRQIEARLPVVAAINAAAPAPRQSAFARARRGAIETVAADAPADTFLKQAESRPWRSRPKRMRLAVATSAADRLKAMTETRSGEGAVMINPSSEDAASAIYAYLFEKRIIEHRP